MSEQLGLLFLGLFVLAAAACIYLSITMSRRVQMGINRWRNEERQALETQLKQLAAADARMQIERWKQEHEQEIRLDAIHRSSAVATSFAPCTKDQFEQWTRAEDTEKGACKRVLAANYAPYVDISPVQLPSGDIITPLSGPAQGYLAVLNPVGLTEKHRLKLARCP